MDGLIAIAGVLALLLGAGALLGLVDRRHFRPGWLLATAALVFLNDFLLTRGYGVLPRLIEGVERNWQGQALALVATLILLVVLRIRPADIGLTLRQKAGSLPSALAVAAAYCLFFLVLAFLFPNEPASGEEIAFQLTMPGLQEEPFYRGLLLFALDRAFTGRVRFLGVDWGWGALLSSALFGLAHGFGWSDGGFSIDPMIFALTAIPSLLAVWLRYRTGSLLLPVLVHNFGNAIFLFL